VAEVACSKQKLPGTFSFVLLHLFKKWCNYRPLPVFKWMYYEQILTVYRSVKEEMFQSPKEGTGTKKYSHLT
jgi:hypothetical protein